MQSFCRHGSWARHHAETFRACASASTKAAEFWQPVNMAPSATIATVAGMELRRVEELAFVAMARPLLRSLAECRFAVLAHRAAAHNNTAFQLPRQFKSGEPYAARVEMR